MTRDLERSLGRIEGNLEEVLRRLDNYEKRITSLEKWTWKLYGASAILFVGWTMISDKIVVALGFK